MTSLFLLPPFPLQGRGKGGRRKREGKEFDCKVVIVQGAGDLVE